MRGRDGCRESQFSVSSIPDDWDLPVSEEDLEAIDAAIRSASSTPADCQAPKNRSLGAAYSAGDARVKPTLKFGGHIVYSRTVTEVEKATNELLDTVDALKRDKIPAVLGFDIEWRPTFKKGVPRSKAAVVQICGGNNCCYVLHIIHSGIPQTLQSLLEDPASIKVGVGIAGDSLKLFQDYNVSTKSLEDLSSVANRKFGGDPKRWSLAALCDVLVSKELEKPNKIRLGNWATDCLSEDQLRYAATDAYASWFLYEVLRNMPDATENGDCEGEMPS